MTALAPELVATRRGDDVDITHLVCCCDDDTAQCGWDVSNDPWAEDDSTDDCVVCRDLWSPGSPCPRCGCEDC